MRGPRLLWLAILFAAAVLHADYADNFRQGILASERKEWTEVVRRMQAAIAENPRESHDRVFIYGVHYEPYLPHLWLGLAYSNLQQCDAALRELSESEKQVEVTKTSRYRDLQIASYQCQKKVVAKPSEPAAKPSDEAAAAAATTAQAQIDVATRTAQEASRVANADPDLADRFAQASSHLTAAKRRLEAGKAAKNPDEISAAGDMASIARGELELILRDATTVSTKADEERQRSNTQRLQTEIVQRLGDARIAVVLATRDKPRPPLSDAVRELQQQIDRARNAAQITSPDALRQFTDTLAADTARVQKLTTQAAAQKSSWPPTPLFEAAASFFNGNYKRSLAALDRASFDDPVSSSQTFLFRSAAHYSLYVLGGERDASLRNAAIQEIRKCRATDRRTAPALGDFSPRFVQFFAAVR